jgi:HAD superfamily hydrolase (TIGR01509 family)|tara:strand:+ start:1330 stop:1992 length:663 start_codon:yes stop_codon:yes gene_type:complete
MLLSYQNQQCDLKDIDAAIFDLDGTLVESEPVWAEAKQYIANRENVDVSEHILLAYVGRSVADFVAEVIAPANAQLIEKAIIERALARYDYNVFEIPGASDLVRALSENGFATAICSSAPEKAIQKCVQLLNIGSCINEAVSSEFLAKGKPDKFPYVETLRRLGVPAERAIVFEDASAGLTSSISAGIKTICVGSAAKSRSFDCAVYAENIGDISLVASH